MTRVLTFVFLMLLSIGSTRAFAVDGSYSGNWFNPQQSGHGIVLEVISPTRALFNWYVYDGAGNQVWLSADGTITGNRIDAQVGITGGMHFGTFDPAQYHITLWGTASLEFTSCDAATLSWNSTYTANGFSYGSGSVPLQRLTKVDGTQCGKRAAAGIYSGFISSTPRNASYQVLGSLDERGQLHLAQLDGTAVYDGTYTTNGNTITLNATGYATRGHTFPNNATTSTIAATVPYVTHDYITGPFTGATDNGTLSLAYVATYDRGSSLASIAGAYKDVFNGVTTTLTISAAGVVTGSDTASCQYTGNAAPIDPRFNTYTFDYAITGCAQAGTYSGVAFFSDAFLFGDNKQLILGARTTTTSMVLALTKQ